MMKFYKILFFFTLMLGSLISISSYSWMSMWMGLEINLLAIIPLFKNSNNIFPSESALKYFIAQTMASLILMFSIIMTLNLNEFMPLNSFNNLVIMMNSAFLMKMGAAPLHFWFPEIMEGLNWMNCLLMLTWQKIAPMILLMYNLKLPYFFSTIIIFSALIGSILGFNQISMRKILTYSSINHIAWMIASMLYSNYIWMIYFIIYSLISMNIIFLLKYFNIYFIKQLLMLLNSKKMLKIFFFLNFFSLGGLPPFLGFFPKWLTINSMIQNYFILTSLILIMSTLITLFFYIRLTFSSIILFNNENLLYKNINLFWFTILNNFFSLLGLIFCTLIFNFY
nr:NADH dehydrogenase subunit 2 [Ulochaetes vacca]